MKKVFISSPLEEEILLPKDITHHILHVFRHDIRKPILVTGSDSRCGYYEITGETNGSASAKLVEYVEIVQNESRLILVQSLLKGDKLEWVLQKATELNVDTIYLVSTKNNVVKYDQKKLEAKLQRWEKIVLEASQQCGRNTLPSIIISETLESVLHIESNALRLVAYENEEGRTLKDELQDYKQCNAHPEVLICIGPEGGFQDSEINGIIKSGGKSISLGSTILRAETAAIAALAMMQYELEL